jgi:hypothetical protein
LLLCSCENSMVCRLTFYYPTSVGWEYNKKAPEGFPASASVAVQLVYSDPA